MNRTRWLTLAAIIVVALAGWFVVAANRPDRIEVDAGTVVRQARFVSTVSASGEIVASRYADIGSSAMGKIVALPVAEGDRVRRGQLLARIDPVQARSDATGASEQRAALEAEARASVGQVRAAESDLAAAEAVAREAELRFARTRDLHTQGLVAAADLDSARAASEASAAQVAASRAAVDRARGVHDAAVRRVAQARAQVTRASDVLAKTAIVSPIDGVVSRLRVREGEMVVVGIQNQPGTTLMTISDLDAIDAEVKAAEADVLRLALGQSASVALEALPGRRFTGRVVEIGASALPSTGAGNAAREFKVVVRLDQPDRGLRPGLTCDVEVVTSERRDVQTVPLQSVAIRKDGTQGSERSGVFAIVDGRAVFTPVTTGVIGGLDIEVSGLRDGASIVVGPYQVLREMSDGALVEVSRRTR